MGEEGTWNLAEGDSAFIDYSECNVPNLESNMAFYALHSDPYRWHKSD